MSNDFIDIVVSPLVPPLATLLAALGGAYYGAKFQYNNQVRTANKKRQDTEVAAANRAVFVLFRQYNELVLLQREIDEQRRNPLRSITLPCFPPLNHDVLRFEFESLCFLLETKHRDCIPELYIAESKFQKTAWLINERSRCHHDEVQPRLEMAGLTAGENRIVAEGPEQFLIDILGDRLAVTISRLTSDFIEYVDTTVPFLKQTSDNLNTALKELYPNRTIINFGPLEQETPHGTNGSH